MAEANEHAELIRQAMRAVMPAATSVSPADARQNEQYGEVSR